MKTTNTPHQHCAPGQTVAANTACARCGEKFGCGAVARSERCWCMSFPALPAPRAGTGCYCPACLSALNAR